MNALKQLRRQKGWSQKKLAEKSGVGQDTISTIESKSDHEPRPSTLEKLATALEVDVADFLREENFPKDEEIAPTDRDKGWSLPSFGVWRRALGDFNERALERLERLPESPSAEELEAEREWIGDTLLASYGLVDQMKQTGVYDAMNSYLRGGFDEQPVPDNVRREILELSFEVNQALGFIFPKARNWFSRFAEREQLEQVDAIVARWRTDLTKSSISPLAGDSG